MTKFQFFPLIKAHLQACSRVGCQFQEAVKKSDPFRFRCDKMELSIAISLFKKGTQKTHTHIICAYVLAFVCGFDYSKMWISFAIFMSISCVSLAVGEIR